MSSAIAGLMIVGLFQQSDVASRPRYLSESSMALVARDPRPAIAVLVLVLVAPGLAWALESVRG